MAELELHEEAVGDCIVCGEDATGSLYWIRMSDDEWAIIRPLVAPMFRPDMVQAVFFIPPLNKPLCGSQCSVRYKEKADGETT